MSNAKGPVTILWDYENCPAPKRGGSRGLSGTLIVERLRTAFRDLGPISEVKAFGNVSTIPPELREELQTSAVSVVDAISVTKRKDLVDKMIFTAMFGFALDHPPPATIVLISGDVDYALPLSALSFRHYFIVLVKPTNAVVSEKLIGIANQVYHWDQILFPERMTAFFPRQLLKSLVDPVDTTSDDSLASDDEEESSEDEYDIENAMVAVNGNNGNNSTKTNNATITITEEAESKWSRKIATGLYLSDLFFVLLKLYDLGDCEPLVSKVGIHLSDTFPVLFRRKASLPQLLKLSEDQGLVSILGEKPKHYCKFKPELLQKYIEKYGSKNSWNV